MIAPPTTAKTHSDADSDSDWDDDDDFTKKINIKIKPIAQVTPSKISASVDELRATVGTWKSLANINLVKPNSRRHHQSTVQLNDAEQNASPILVPTATSSTFEPINPAASDCLAESDVNPAVDHRHTIISSLPKNDFINNVLDFNGTHQQPQTQTQVSRDLDSFNGLFVSKIESPSSHDQVSNGILHPLSSASLFSPSFDLTNSSTDTKILTQYPVAFAVQECLNARLIKSNDGNNSLSRSRASLIGKLKMAIPTPSTNAGSIIHNLEENLSLTLISLIPWDKVRLNPKFVTENVSLESPFTSSSKTMRKLTIDIKSVKNFVDSQYSHRPDAKYFVLPELLNYAIGSQDGRESIEQREAPKVNPLDALAHWLCDLTVTKVKVDISFLGTTLDEFRLGFDDVRDLRITLQVNGGVASYQSKPEASWNPLTSELTWSFSSIAELVQKSTLNGVTSCLARFNLNDGPSTPSDVNLSFSIAGKTISGTHVIPNDTDNFRVTKQKKEVRTGVFQMICEPPCATFN